MAVVLAFVITAPLAKADWKIVDKANPLGPGSAVDVLQGGKPVARLVYGEGQIKPFLHVFGTDGELVTNPGLDKQVRGLGFSTIIAVSSSAGTRFHPISATTTCGIGAARGRADTIS